MKSDFSIKLKSRSWLTFDECISKGREWALEKWAEKIIPYSDPWEVVPDWWNSKCSSIEYECEKSFPRVNEWLQIIPNTEGKIFQLFEEAYTHCIEKHGWRGAFYERGFLNYKLGNLELAYDDVLKVIEASELDGEDNSLLPTEIQLQKGTIELEMGLYNDAIVSLSRVIYKDPQNVEAYFQRAAAHFETGQFDKALQDYRTIRMEFPPEEKGLSFHSIMHQALWKEFARVFSKS
jgi:tetratricopeptide (TPR) repeat protein